MNKYVLRTSLVWLALLMIIGGASFYFIRYRPARKSVSPDSAQVQPAAVGLSAPSTMNVPTAPATQPAVSPIELTPERMQSIGVQIGTVERKSVSGEIRATGTADINERLIAYIQVRYSGYIRRVFANATYQLVRKGDPLFTIYSPELVATEKEYLLALKNEELLRASTVTEVASGAAAVVAGSKERLQQWNIPETDITSVEQTREPVSDLTVTSPFSGFITERAALPNLYVEPATRLYTIADLSRIWVYAQVFQDDVGRLKPGDAAEITVDAYPGRVTRGRIESILPQVDLATRTVRVRLDVSNADLRLKPGMFVNVSLKFSLGEQLLVPSSAVLQTGTRSLVFLDAGNGKLEPREVTVGPRVDDNLAILNGLSANQHIVTSANFLVDSESQLQAAAGAFNPPEPAAPVASAQRPPASQVNIDFTTDPSPPRKGNNTFRVKLTGPSGSLVSGANVTVVFYMAAMPAMGMAAMRTETRLTSAGPGVYQGTGALGSGGLWQVTITAQKNGQTVATKQLRVNAAGGM